MNLIYGDEKRFFEFTSNLTDKDKIALIAHDDLDGMVSALIVEKVIGIDYLDFFHYKKDVLLTLEKELKKKKINKIICVDLNLENEHTNLKKLENFAEILVIDHHRGKDFNSDKTVYLLGESRNPACLLCFELFKKLQNLDYLDFILSLAVISDYGWKGNEDFILKVEEKYKLHQGKTFEESELWKSTQMLINCLVYFKEDLKKFYEILKNLKIPEDIKKFEKYSEVIEKEKQRLKKDFEKNKETYDWGYYWFYSSKFSIGSVISTTISETERDKLYIIAHESGKNEVTVNARNQNRQLDCSQVLNKAIQGIPGANAGGHIAAAGGQIQKEYLKKFKENLINSLASH